MVHFADYYYTRPSFTPDGHAEYMPGRKNGKWRYIKTLGRHFDKNKFEEFKTRFYRMQGWDVSTGYPTGETLNRDDCEYEKFIPISNRMGEGTLQCKKVIEFGIGGIWT